MTLRRTLLSLPLACVLGACTATPASTRPMPNPGAAAAVPAPCAADAGWSEPTAPRKVFGNTWFVGTCSIGVFLVTSPRGHVLIDGATAQAAPSIAANIRAAGYRVEDIHTILVTHEHHDHVGGVAALQALSGATVRAPRIAAEALRAGISDRRDPQFELAERFPAVPDVTTLREGGTVAVGSLRLRHLPNAGHTAGGSGWAWTSCEGGTCRRIVFPDSVTAISDDRFRYRDHPDHVAAFRRSLATIASQRCDILVTTHVQASDLLARLDGRMPLVDAGACRAYAARGLAGLDARLAKERTGP